MNADNMLYHPDFRAFERSFQMMTQVAGRSGRSEKQEKYKPIILIIIPFSKLLLQIMRECIRNNYMIDKSINTHLILEFKINLESIEIDKLKEGSWLYQVMQKI
jgi:primosomal protein N' (replication factor Y)